MLFVDSDQVRLAIISNNSHDSLFIVNLRDQIKNYSPDMLNRARQVVVIVEVGLLGLTLFAMTIAVTRFRRTLD